MRVDFSDSPLNCEPFPCGHITNRHPTNENDGKQYRDDFGSHGHLRTKAPTIGLDLGERTSYYCVLEELAGEERAKRCDHRQGNAGDIRGHGAQPHGAGNRDAFPIGEPAAERVGARSDRGACAQGGIAHSRVRMEGWRQWRLGGGETVVHENENQPT